MTALECDQAAARWTAEQLFAIENRAGELLLDAGAGSGKTSVLVERFVRAVREDDVDVGAILTITFTEKAAAELRERIRRRLQELGEHDAARATEGAFISTIHGFCVRVLRAQALAAGLDPGFVVLDEQQARRLADAASEAALEQLAREGAVDLIAAYTPAGLRGAIAGAYGELRSRGQTEPRLPPLPPAPDLDGARGELQRAAAAAAAELGELADPSAKVIQATERLGRCDQVLAGDDPWPGELDALRLPGGNGAALSSAVCCAYVAALERFRAACGHRHAAGAHAQLERLLELFGARYAALKRDRSALDFADLELQTRDLLVADRALRERYRGRFCHVMVDELQDTNAVQLELIDQVADGNLFCVGDAFQSIYGFRHADVELFEALGTRLEARGERATLRTNFRSRPEILNVIAAAFAPLFGERFPALVPGRACEPAHEPRVELLVVDKAADWEAEGLAAPWRVAEAAALARRVETLIAAGAAPSDCVVLTRATTDLRAYERALEERGIPTYVIGGRGYWGHPQVLDVVAYLRALANPRDELALYTLLHSPLVGAALDTVVVLAASAHERGRDPWWLLSDPDGALDELPLAERERLARFASWFVDERGASARVGVERLIERLLERTAYDMEVLAMPGGRRRLANIRKLMRLGREHEAQSGPDLHGFLELVRGRTEGWAGFGDARESEAPVEGEALDAVRLMTIHRAKGLEFEIVCVADLGRAPWRRGELLRLGRDGRFGIRLAAPGTGRREPALDYEALGAAQLAAEAREEKRVFYVAMTRARERLILSGAASLENPDRERSPMGWIMPAIEAAGVAATVVQPQDREDGHQREDEEDRHPPVTVPAATIAPPAPVGYGAPLSYSALAAYARCGYRFYVERVLGIPPLAEALAAAAAPTGLGAAERGSLIHSLLERLDFRRPSPPSAAAVLRAGGGLAVGDQDAQEIAALIARFCAGPICARLARASDVRREERFSFLLAGEGLITGVLDVLAREPGGRMLIVDYKSDRLEGAGPAAVVARAYRTQQLVYALAALRGGAEAVEVVHLFLESPDAPVSIVHGPADAAALEQELSPLAAGARMGRFKVTERPHAAVCHGCPAENGLCSWPLEMTRREDPDTTPGSSLTLF